MLLLYLIDGYNLLYSSFREWIEKFGLENARQFLINFLRSYKRKFIIVFDGREEYPNYHMENVIFTKGKSADEYIKNFLKNYKNKDEIIVVSNDKSIINYAKMLKVKTISTKQFLNERKNKEIKEEKINFDEITKEIMKEWGLT
jgi:predicted RNA-binding protein with PIN domain